MTKTMDELRRSTEVCEHGSQERKCIVCEGLAQDVEIERLETRVKELESPDFERIAAVQHEIWSHWMRYLFSCSVETIDGDATIPSDKVQRWKRQLETPYSELTVKEQASDLEQAAKVISVLTN